MSEPTSLRAGDSVAWDVDLSDYPSADGWALKYKFLFATGTADPFTATPGSGGAYSVALAATDTAGYTAGQATLLKWVEKTGLRVTLEQIAVTILPDIAVAANFDGRSANAVTLANLETALSSLIASGSGGVARARVEGRETEFRDVKSLTDLIDYYRRRVSAENAAGALLYGQTPGRVYTRM